MRVYAVETNNNLILSLTTLNARQQGKEKVKVSRIIQEKAKDNLELALNDYAKEILEEYEGKFLNALPVISNQKTNDYLKEIGEMAKLITPVNRVNHVGGKRIDCDVLT